MNQHTRDMNTNWSLPSRTLLAALNSLRKALAAGYRAKLIRAWNQDCSHPVLIKNDDRDFRNFEFQNGHAACRTSILADENLSDFQKHLALNYVTLYGTPEAVDQYYTTGELSPDNDNGIGRSHLALVTDLVTMLQETRQHSRANMFTRQYLTPGYDSVVHLYSFYRYKHGSMYAARKFKRKVWVVVLLNDDEQIPRTPVMVHVLNAVALPLKYVPTRRVLHMDNYRCVTYRIGSVVNGLSVQFTIPKKFGFSNELD